MFRKDRSTECCGFSRGGGVLIAVKSNLQAVQVEFLNLTCESVMVKLLFGNGSTLFICCVYCSPNCGRDYYTYFYDSCELLIDFNADVIVLGDFNLPGIDWFNLDFINVSYSVLISDLFRFMSVLDLTQYNLNFNSLNKLLDLVLAKVFNFSVEVFREDFSLVAEDNYHPALCIQLQSKRVNKSDKVVAIPEVVYDFKNANYDLLYLLLSLTNWNELNLFDNVNNAVECFYRILYLIFDTCVPKKLIKNRKFPIWFSSDLISLIKKKNKFRKHLNINYNLDKINSFKELRRLIKIRIGVDYKTYLMSIDNTLSSNPKEFWKFCSYKNKNKVNTCKMSYNSVELNNSNEIVEGFASYFQSVFKVSSNLDNFSNETGCNNIFDISDNDIVDSIKQLKSSRSVGFDNVPSFIIKSCYEFFIYPLLIIFNISMQTCTFPDKWKISKVCPIYKKGAKSDITNYRPIAILSVFSKVFEKIVHKKLYSETSNIICNQQHGFLPKRSTVTNLLTINNEITTAFEQNSQIDVVYTDFSKAFDSIDFSILCHKLLTLGLSYNLIMWIYSFMSNRNLYVYFLGSKSNYFVSTSGVPQGSTLGPLLFILFINDLPEIINYSKCLLFADDLKLFMRVTDIQDCFKLQSDLDNLILWCSRNKLFLNIQKCAVVSFSCKITLVQNNYILGNEIIQRYFKFKDLGVLFDSKLCFRAHIEDISTRAYRSLGYILRNFSNLNNNTQIVLFNYFVRTKLEYASVIWDTNWDSYNYLIEKIQNKFLRFLFFRTNNYYPQNFSGSNLRDLYDIQELKVRRDICNLVFFYKVLNNDIDCALILNLISIHVPNLRLRNRPYIFHEKLCKTHASLKFAVNRFSRLYNLISDDVDIFHDSLSTFKRKCFRLLS